MHSSDVDIAFCDVDLDMLSMIFFIRSIAIIHAAILLVLSLYRVINLYWLIDNMVADLLLEITLNHHHHHRHQALGSQYIGHKTLKLNM